MKFVLSDIVTFFGRVHPLIVHLPIGFLLLAVIFDGLSYFKKYDYLGRAVPLTLLLGFVSSVAACVFGYMLSLSGDYDAVTLSNHKRSGIALALLAGVLYAMTLPIVQKKIVILRPFFSMLSVITFLLLSYAGHQGGNLTHGNDYITLQTLTHQEREKPATAEVAMIFEDVVQPVLEKRCVSCHQQGKRKGELLLDNLASMLKGGKSGAAVVPGKPDESELYRRITLDPSHEDFMPTDGKTPLTKTETAVIAWWIEHAQAQEGKKLADLPDYKKILPQVSAVLGFTDDVSSDDDASLTVNINPDIPLDLDMKLIENLRKKGFMVRVMFQKPVMLDVTLLESSGKKMEEVRNDLTAVAGNIVWLNLSNNNFTDSDLDILKTMVNVEKLRLENNPVTDGISEHLAGLKHLEAVNLNGTAITADGLKRLQQNTALKRIYTWRTNNE